MKWKMLIAGGVIAAGAAFVALNPWARVRAREAWGKIRGGSAPAEAQAESRPAPEPFRGTVDLTAREREALGVDLAEVKEQDQPTLLDVHAKTDYDPNSLYKIRPKFKSLIDKVLVGYGQSVKKGQPLVEVFSADLAQAKGEYETKATQWQVDQTELARATKLLKTGSISEKEFLKEQSDEKQSGTAAKIARDRLEVYGLSAQEIDAIFKEDGIQKAKMTLRSPADGVVIQKEVVAGNLYDENDVLLTVAPLDHFWVHGYVYPSDASKVKVGETKWVIHCKSAGKDFIRTVDSVTSEIDPDTKTIKIRTEIDNTDNAIKANMLVNSQLQVPPVKGHTTIPRLAMVSSDGGNYAFVLKPGDGSRDAKDRFERRSLGVAQEMTDEVIVATGLAPGERVATKGSLLLMQMYEDSASLESGPPAEAASLPRFHHRAVRPERSANRGLAPTLGRGSRPHRASQPRPRPADLPDRRAGACPADGGPESDPPKRAGVAREFGSSQGCPRFLNRGGGAARGRARRPETAS